ncbi:ABC transporter ATP-binding protein [Rufibacter roseolus]|uniref:ABC transporter ATP-binding protein n=1 Tax=Rufibacter roseolus TaxID=2817375 RepID=UPI001B303FAF|nr:ABC transporter ATP-binding protein [Rufibacter roseolus]
MKSSLVFEVLSSFTSYLNKREKRYAVLMFVLLLVSSVLDVFGLASLVPVIMAASKPDMILSNKYLKFVYQSLGFSDVKYFLIFLIVGIFVFFLFKNLFTIWINYKQVRFTARIGLNIINRQFDKYTNLPYWHLSNLGSSRLVNQVNTVPSNFINVTTRHLFTFFSEVAIIFVIVLGILFYQPILFILLVAILAPSTYLTYSSLKQKSERVGRETNNLRPVSFSILTNTFNGYVELKLADKINYFKDKYIKNQKEVQDLEAKTQLINAIPLKTIEMVAILGIVIIFLYGLFLPEYSGSIVAIVGLFAAAAYRLMPSINRLLTAMMSMKQTFYTVKDLKNFQEFEKNTDSPVVQKPLKFQKEIEFDNLSFSFPEAKRSVLENVSLTVKKGEKVGFIGVSGSGKTTLMNILLRFYIEQKGKILVDGIPLTDENLKDWYKMIGYVKQDTFLMESSIKDNITLGDVSVDMNRLEYALKYASLIDMVKDQPDGVDTLIGERGSKLSGGQKQRVGIARALYKNTQVLILDEATSALDTNTEREVSEAINNLSGTDLTIFMIAHRVTTLRDCDRIYELRNGKIIKEWTYKNLIDHVV